MQARCRMFRASLGMRDPGPGWLEEALWASAVRITSQLRYAITSVTVTVMTPRTVVSPKCSVSPAEQVNVPHGGECKRENGEHHDLEGSSQRRPPRGPWRAFLPADTRADVRVSPRTATTSTMRMRLAIPLHKAVGPVTSATTGVATTTIHTASRMRRAPCRSMNRSRPSILGTRCVIRRGRSPHGSESREQQRTEGQPPCQPDDETRVGRNSCLAQERQP